MADYTASGFWYPTDGDLLKPLEKNFQKLAESIEQVFDSRVGLQRLVPQSISSGYVNGQGDMVITGEADNQNTVRLTGLFDWSRARAYKVIGAFTQCTQDESFSIRFGTGKVDDNGPNYHWTRMKIKEGTFYNDWGRNDDRVAVTARPGDTGVSSHMFELDITRPGHGSFIHGSWRGHVDRNHHIGMVNGEFSYNAVNDQPDSIRIWPSFGGSAYQGMVRAYAYN